MEHQQHAGWVGPASAAASATRPARSAPTAHPGPTRAPRALAQAALSLALRSILAGAAVVAVAELLRHLAPGPALAALVALATVGHVVVVVWMAMTGPVRLEELVRTGAWAGCVLVLGTLALTSWVLFGQLLAVLTALTLLRLLLDRD